MKSFKYNDLPSYQKLLELEKLARVQGSGIDLSSLIGIWKFHSVWDQGRDNKNDLFSTLLQTFSATLQLKRAETIINTKNSDQLEIINSIRFGFLSLYFCGGANLKRENKILLFYFNRIEVRLGKLIIFKRSIASINETNMPFFTLIAQGKEGWLSARGKGGGLALWIEEGYSSRVE